MSQKLQKTRGAGRSSGGVPHVEGMAALRGGEARGRADTRASGDDDGQVRFETPFDGRSDLHSIQYILAMVHDLKKLAARSGHQRVALILEMAELEARDQIRKPNQ